MPISIDAFVFKTPPYAHQEKALLASAIKECFALFMDMGTGKTKVVIDTAAYLYSQGLIDALVVVAPNGVHRNWVVNEIPAHMPEFVNCKAHYYQASGGAKQKRAWEAVFKHADGLRAFCFNTEAASNKKGQEELRTCVQTGKTLFVIDESQRIKTPGAKRTQFLVRLAKYAAYKRILSGSPITQSPLDLYAQCKFLDPCITGYSTFTGFRSHYAEIEQRRSKHTTKSGRPIYYDHIAKYKNIDELERRIAPHCYRVMKDECLDLPDKVYEKVYVDLTPEQKRVYKDLLDKSVAALGDECAVDIPPELHGADKEQLMLFYATNKVSASNAMVKLLRLQQVICGALPDDEGNVTVLQNNRLKVLKELVEDIPGKIIIWARFKYDLMLIAGMLMEEYGDQCLAQFHGSIPQDARTEGVSRFQKDPSCRFFLSQQHSGGTGLTLTAASNVIYYSNDFSAEARWQSEDRAHRIGQKCTVTYHDLVAPDTVDEKILQALEEKRDTAEAFNYAASPDDPDIDSQYNDYEAAAKQAVLDAEMDEEDVTIAKYEGQCPKLSALYEQDEWL